MKDFFKWLKTQGDNPIVVALVLFGVVGIILSYIFFLGYLIHHGLLLFAFMWFPGLPIATLVWMYVDREKEND